MDLVTNNDSSEDDMDFENCTDLPLPEPSQTTENCCVHLPKLEEQFYRCFGLEIFTVSRNLEIELEQNGLSSINLYHVVLYCLQDALALIVKFGSKLFQEKCNKKFTIEIALSCLIFKAYLGAYNTSPSSYFADQKEKRGQYLHHDFFPDVSVLRAFDAVLDSDKVMRQTAETNRPGFRSSPSLFKQLNENQVWLHYV